MFSPRKSLIKIKLELTNIIQRWATHWANIPMGPPDPVIGLVDRMKKDTDKNKVPLTMGTYRDEKGKPHVLRSVKKASEYILQRNMSKEYLPIEGDPKYRKASADFAFGKNPCLKGRLVSVQCLGGTGSICLGGMFLARFWPGVKTIYVTKPTWPPHKNILSTAGLEVKEYTYTNLETNILDPCGMLTDIRAMPDHSIILFQACAHNPTGEDLDQRLWMEVADIIKHKNMLPFFDMALQGLVSGSVNDDAFAPRYFVEQGITSILATCFSKNMGLYAERIGTLIVSTGGKEESDRVMSQLKMIIRPLYSSPPVSGARIVVEILSNEILYKMWLKELAEMLKRIKDTRFALYDALMEQKSKAKWDGLMEQVGPYFYMNMCDERVERLRTQFHIYVARGGRLTLSGLNSDNIKYVAKGLHEVTK